MPTENGNCTFPEVSVDGDDVFLMLPMPRVRQACCIKVALFPGPRCFQLHKEHGGPGISSHVRNINGRKVVEST